MAEKEAREAEATIAHLRENGRHADADELEKKLAVHRQQLEEYKRLAAEEEVRSARNDPKNIDFANPTPEQIADAKKHGIDLLDPLIVKELQRMQRQEQQGGEGEDDADNPDEEEMGARGAPPPWGVFSFSETRGRCRCCRLA
jgi:hypothetical protein